MLHTKHVKQLNDIKTLIPVRIEHPIQILATPLNLLHDQISISKQVYVPCPQVSHFAVVCAAEASAQEAAVV
jgi:hypothetical protein